MTEILVVIVVVEQLTDAGRVAEIVEQLLPPGSAAPIRERRIGRVGAFVDPPPERVPTPARERALEQLPVLQRDDPPFQVAEDVTQTKIEPVLNDRIETLPVVVDDPPQVRHLVLPRLEQGLEDVPLVKLRFARERDHAAGRRPIVGKALEPHVVLHQGGKAGHRDAEPHGTCRKVDVVTVLRTRRIRLRAAKGPKPLELVARLLAEEVLDGMKDRAGVRLDGDAIPRPEHFEVERRHQRRDRGTRRLVASHLQPVARRAEVIRLVNHPDREPEHFVLDRSQDLDRAANCGWGRL